MPVSLVLPCYEPPAGWALNIVTRYNELLQDIDQIELVIVQDGVSDRVKKEDIALLKQHIPSVEWIEYAENKGKGYAIRQGIKNTSNNIVIYTDIDFPYTNESIVAVYHMLNSGNTDVAVGIKDSAYYSNVSFQRRVISRYLRWMIRNLLSVPITDTQCGLKGFTGKAKEIFLQTTINRYLFDLEFIHDSHKAGYRLKAIPVTLNADIQFRKVNYRIILSELVNFCRLIFK